MRKNLEVERELKELKRNLAALLEERKSIQDAENEGFSLINDASKNLDEEILALKAKIQVLERIADKSPVAEKS